jgi:hypothetical protein
MGEGDSLWQIPSLFDQVNNGPEDELKYMHKSEVDRHDPYLLLSLNYAAGLCSPDTLLFNTSWISKVRSVCFLGDDPWANCMTSGTKAEQFARCCLASGSRVECGKRQETKQQQLGALVKKSGSPPAKSISKYAQNLPLEIYAFRDA